MTTLIWIYVAVAFIYGMYHANKFLDSWIKDNPQYATTTIYHWTTRVKLSAVYGIVFMVATFFMALFMPLKLIEDTVSRKRG